MATARFNDKPQLSALVGTEVVPATAVDGGTDVSAAPVAAGSDIKIPLSQLAAFCAAYRSKATAITHAASGALTLDYALGDFFIVTLQANVTSMAISNPPPTGYGGSIRVRFIQDATGGRTVALPSAGKAITGSDGAVQSAANAQTVLHLTTDNGGMRWDYSMKGGAA